jgi:tetratricopeptide (TPR) repeat protein
MRHSTLAVVMVCFLLCGLADGQAVDTVVPQSGSPVRGHVTDVSRTGVSLENDTARREIPANQIRYIVFAGEPSSMRQIRDAANTGNVERAERYLERLDASALPNDFSRADYAFYRALTQKHKAIQTGAGLTEAAKVMLAFVNANPKSFHFYDAAEALGDLAVAMQRPDGAAKYYGQLEKAPWPDVQFRGTVRMAAALRAQGGDKLAEAVKRYDTIIDANVEGVVESEAAERQKKIAIAGKASCQAEIGETAGGIAALQSLIEVTAAEDEELLAVAHNALGDCYRAAGQPKDALLAYLHTDLLFPRQQKPRAEALFQISRLWTELDRSDRSEQAKGALRAEFAGSRWAKMLN